MSFGFSVGDFLTVAQLANKVRKEFVGAPSQFNGISDECVAPRPAPQRTQEKTDVSIEQGQEPFDHSPGF